MQRGKEYNGKGNIILSSLVQAIKETCQTDADEGAGAAALPDPIAGEVEEIYDMIAGQDGDPNGMMSRAELTVLDLLWRGPHLQ